jgi:Ni,Fe-hydrogenase maturation factor
VMLVGCEPASLGSDEGHMGLTPAVEGAVAEAVRVVERLVEKILHEDQQPQPAN